MKTMTNTKTPEEQDNSCVAFYRISSDKQDNLRQYQDVRRYCEAMNYNIVEEFEETISGAAELSERKQLQLFLEYIENNKVKYCIVSELSRLGRSNLTLDVIEKLTKLKICFISLKEGFRTLNSDGSINTTTQLIIDILNSINKFELSVIRYRVKSGLRKVVNRGDWSGGMIPLGYNLVDKKLVINEDEAHIVKTIFEKFTIDGWGTHKISGFLNVNNLLSKKGSKWNDPKLYKILNNGIYIGKRNWNKETIDMPEARIISDEMFSAAQDRIKNRLNISELNNQKKHDYLLQGKIICACHKNFIGRHKDGTYMCKSKKYAGGCNTKSVKMSWLDNEVIKLILNNSKLVYDYSGISDERKRLQDEKMILEQRIEDEKRRQNNWINNINRIGQKAFEEKFDSSKRLEEQLQKQIDEINVRLNNTKNYISRLNDNGVLISELRVKDTKNKVDVDKEIIRKVIDRIDIDNENINVKMINGQNFIIKR